MSFQEGAAQFPSVLSSPETRGKPMNFDSKFPQTDD